MKFAGIISTAGMVMSNMTVDKVIAGLIVNIGMNVLKNFNKLFHFNFSFLYLELIVIGGIESAGFKGFAHLKDFAAADYVYGGNIPA